MQNKWNELQISLSQLNFLSSNNRVIKGLQAGNLSPQEGFDVLKQYYFLVVTIVQFLTIAMVRIPNKKVKEELFRNLGEELGSRTGGTSHQELLEVFARQELGLELRATWNEGTKNFITSLLLDFNTRSPHAVAGMTYALEATACPELLVVAEIINLSAKREVANMNKLRKRTEQTPTEVKTLQDFLAAHTLDFELGHESGLRTTLDEFVSQDWKEFEEGFWQVISLMEIWWKKLSKA